ncbi:MAG: MBL fold metallo-hydrolase [Proteobacteria bacterium]|nr:MBL fold metallo-hydrolase [Pseudomonadota bacterium]
MDSARVIWIGHATALIEMAGVRVLVDPLGRRRCRAVGEYHAVLITHAHVDHLNRWTLAVLDKGVPLFVPRGARDIVADLGFARVVEVEPGDQLAVGKLDIVGVPTRHDTGRWRKNDHPICTGYVIARDGMVVHHAGDVDMSTYDVFDDIGRDFAVDVTLLPIGGMLPVWYYRMRQKSIDRGVHIDPDTALAIAQRIGAQAMIPVHWGTVNLRLGPPSMPRRRLLKAAEQTGLSDLVKVLGHGESLQITRRLGHRSDSPRLSQPR